MPHQHPADPRCEPSCGGCARNQAAAAMLMHHWLMGRKYPAAVRKLRVGLQATLGVFAWTEKEKPDKLACRAAQAETAAKAKLLARVRALA